MVRGNGDTRSSGGHLRSWKTLGALLLVLGVVYLAFISNLVPVSTGTSHVPIPVLRRAFGIGAGVQHEPRSRGFDLCQDGARTGGFGRSNGSAHFGRVRQQPHHMCPASRPLYTISHPKSGRTWLRCLVANSYACAKKNKTVTLSGTSEWSEKVLAFTHGNPHPFSSTPQELLNGFGAYRPRETGLLVVRDPRDVVVSSYYDRRYRDWERPVPKSMSLSEYLHIERGSLETLLMFLNLWSSVADKPDWFVLRYEDLKRCPVRALDQLLNLHMCIGISGECLERAVSECDFSNLQKRADKASQYGGGKIWRPRGHDPNARKVRKGKVGGYREDLSEEDVEYLEAVIQEHLLGGRIFGYHDPPQPKAKEA